MKTLFVASKFDYGEQSRGLSFEMENFYPVLQSLSAEILEFDFKTIQKQYGKDRMNQKLKETVLKEDPDLIFFVLIDDDFDTNILSFIKHEARGISINWFCDDQWRFDSFSKHYAPYFNFVITTDKLSLQKYKAAGLNHAILSQWASKVHNQLDLTNVNYEYDVSFIGQKNEYREWFIRHLKKKNVHVECFGYGWENGRISFDEMQSIFLKSKINLNISNSMNYDIRYLLSSLKPVYKFGKNKWRNNLKDAEQIKARHFEIGGAGGFQLTNYVPFLEDYFHVGNHIQIYTSIDDGIDKIRYYLNYEDKRAEITARAHEHIVSHHCYEHRFKEILERIKQKSH